MRGNKYLLYVIIALVHAIIFAAANNGVKYTWSEFDERFDCVVGIALGNQPIGTGVFIATNIVITSANVIENYVDRRKETKVYAINGKFDSSTGRSVIKISSPFGPDQHRKGSKYWIKQGYDYENSPVHDIYTLALTYNPEDQLNKPGLHLIQIASINKGDRKIGRYPFIATHPFYYFLITDKNYMFAGFGFVDRDHVKSNTFLEIESYGDEHVLVNCDEWIPREWGYFICILNVGNTAGVPSGAPLFNKGVLVGIGTFTFERGNESIHVFTDLRKYSYQMFIAYTYELMENNVDVYRDYIFYGTYPWIYNRQGRFAKSLEY